jgi:uncharacterized protein (TIGR02118 family)
MIKVCELVQRRAGLDVAEFQQYWREVHGPIVSAIPGIRRYVQSHPLPGGYRSGRPLPVDGVAEIWVDGKDALRAMAATAEFATAKADEPNFIDTAALIELVVDEHVIKAGPIPVGGIASFGFVRFRPDLAPEAAQRYWREVHGPIANGIDQLRRSVQSHVRLGAYRQGARPVWDGLATTWFDSVDDMRRAATTAAYRATIDDGPELLANAVTPTVLCPQLVLVG